MGGLHVPGGDVVQDGVAEHIVFGLPGGHILGILAQHHSQLTLVVQLLHKVGVRLDEAAVRHCTADPLGEVDGVLMLGGKGVRRILFGLVRVCHVVDAQTDYVLCRAGDGALQGDGFHRQRGDAADSQLQTEPHLRGEKGDGVGQGLVGEPQPAQRPDLCAVLREDGRVLHTVRQAAGDKTHTVPSSQCR